MLIIMAKISEAWPYYCSIQRQDSVVVEAVLQDGRIPWLSPHLVTQRGC